MKSLFPTRFVIVCILGLVSMPDRSIAEGDYSAQGLGPMNITGQTPLQTLRLDIVPTRYQVLERGRWELSLFNSLTNRWNRGDNYVLDVEVFHNVVGVTVGIGSESEMGLFVPVVSRSGGGLDPLIAEFHDRLGLGQAGRNEYPANTLLVSFVNRSGEEIVILNDKNRGTFVGDLSLFTRHQLYRGEGTLRSVIWSALLRFPTAGYRGYDGSSEIDGAMSLATSHHLGSVYLYTTLGYALYGTSNLFGLDLRPFRWTFFAAIEYPVNRNLSLIIQQLSNSGTVSEFGDFSLPTHELTLGVKHAVSQRLVLEFGMIENLFVFRNSIDFGLNFGLKYRY